MPHISFGESLRACRCAFRKFLVAVGLFGAGDFAHTMLILLATQKLTPTWARPRPPASRWDSTYCTTFFTRRFRVHRGLAGGSLSTKDGCWLRLRLAAVMAVCVMLLPLKVWTLAASFSRRHLCGDGGNARRFLLRGTWWARNTTAWRSARWPRSTASATFVPALSSGALDASSARRWRLATARCYF